MTREYGDYCGLAHALDLIGSRWTLLIVRELLTGPGRFTDLEQGLPGIPTNVLSSRLRELEESGVVERRLLPRPASGVVYALTEYGQQLEEPLISLGLWGARSLGAPRAGDHFSCSALALGLRSIFHPDRAANTRLSFEIRTAGQHLRGLVEDGLVTVPVDTAEEPDIVIEAEPEILSGIFRGAGTPEEAIASGQIEISGHQDRAIEFFGLFGMPAEPVSADTP